MEQIAEDIVDREKLKFRRFETDHSSVVWSLIEAFEAGEIVEDELREISRDADATLTLPLVLRYSRKDHQDLVVAFLRDTASFNNLEWMDRGHKGNDGTGIRRIFDALIASEAGGQVATLALAHLSRIIAGARFHPGLRRDWQTWRERKDLPPDCTPEERQERMPALYAGILANFDKMRREIAYFGLIIEKFGDEKEHKKLQAIVRELDAEIARFPN